MQGGILRNNTNFLAAAFALTAVSYGLARFAFGLLLPQIRTELSLDISTTGWIGSGAFVAYCVGILATFNLSRLCSLRGIAFAAGLSATIGMVIIVFSTSGLTLGIGIALAGLSTGLTSPPLATAISLYFDDENRPRANSIINAGTAAGIVFSGAASLIAFGDWREIYMVFSLVSCGVTIWIFCSLPSALERSTIETGLFSTLRRPAIFQLCLGSFLVGLSSTGIWTFGGSILRDEFDFTESNVAWIWVALGLAGISGSMTGILVQRFGILRVHRISIIAMAIGTFALSFTSVSAVFGFVSVAIFGAAYIISSGTFLIQGIKLIPDRPDLGLGIPFLVLALGQSTGSPLFGALIEARGMLFALAVFSLVALISSFIHLRYSLET